MYNCIFANGISAIRIEFIEKWETSIIKLKLLSTCMINADYIKYEKLFDGWELALQVAADMNYEDNTC